MPTWLAYTAVFFLTGIAMVILVIQLFPDFERIRAMRRARSTDAARKLPGLFRLSMPFLTFVLPFSEPLKFSNWRQNTAHRLKAAGLSGLITVDEILAFKIFLLVGVVLLGALYTQIVPVPFVILLGIFVFFFTEFWLHDLASTRRKRITRDLPFVLDLLTLSVESGLDFTAAIAKVAERLPPGPTREELETTLKEFRIGASRADALRNLGERVGTRDITSVTAALIQAAEIGASVGATLRQVSEIMRANRFQTAEKKGGESSQKMLIPMVVFIMPAVLIIVMGPILIRFIYSGF